MLGNVRLQQLLEEMGLQACETQCNTQCKMLKKSLRTLKKVENVDALDLRLHLGEISEPKGRKKSACGSGDALREGSGASLLSVSRQKQTTKRAAKRCVAAIARWHSKLDSFKNCSRETLNDCKRLSRRP